MKKLLAIVLIGLLFTSCNNASDMSYETIEKSGYFIVGYNPENYHTFEGYGLAIDVIKTAADRMGLSAPISPVANYNWQAHLTNKTIDIMLCATSGEDLQTLDLFFDSIVMLKSNDTQVSKIGIIDSSTCINEKNKLSIDQNISYVYYSDSQLLLNDLDIGIIDEAILSEYDALSYSNISNYEIEYLSQASVTFVVSSQSLTFYNELNRVLTQMVNDGTINRLKLEYIDNLE